MICICGYELKEDNLESFSETCPDCDCPLSMVEGIKKMRAEINAYKLIFDNAFTIVLNSNDFFGFACADATDIQCPAFPVLKRLAFEFGQEGINALASTVADADPLEEYQTEKYKEAKASITNEEVQKIFLWSEK